MEGSPGMECQKLRGRRTAGTGKYKMKVECPIPESKDVLQE
jgi:hypothetical protein